jgi:hypothetical protein
MNDYENPDDADLSHVTRRLRQFAAAPLTADLEARTLGRLRAGRRASRGVSRTKLLSAAAVAAFFAGGVGLAAADVLPPSAQDVAHNALNAVGVHVPPGHNRYNDPTACPGGPYANHGAYVRAHPNDPNAGKSPCGKPTRAVNPSSPGAENDTGKGAGNGPPPRAKANKDKAGKDQGKSDDAKNGDKESDDPAGAGQPSNTVPKSPPSTHVTGSTTTSSTSPQSTTTTSTSIPDSTTTTTTSSP